MKKILNRLGYWFFEGNGIYWLLPIFIYLMYRMN